MHFVDFLYDVRKFFDFFLRRIKTPFRRINAGLVEVAHDAAGRTSLKESEDDGDILLVHFCVGSAQADIIQHAHGKGNENSYGCR